MKPQKLTTELSIDLTPGEIYLLGYNHYNTGMFAWKHQEISLVSEKYHYDEKPEEKIRLVGQYRYPEQEEFSKPGDYLYEYMGMICRGSGAEPLFILKDNLAYPDQISLQESFQSIGEEYTDEEEVCSLMS